MEIAASTLSAGHGLAPYLAVATLTAHSAPGSGSMRPPVPSNVDARPASAADTGLSDGRPGGQADTRGNTRRRARPEAATPPSNRAMELAVEQALADLRGTRRRMVQTAEGLSPLDRARIGILASVAELRKAIVPPSLTVLDRRR
ncbi:hypothetical protein [Jannaschia marina]|uniref:hypothetical protein n=1 Tax=Jannaschia marina TaxID=2741674 RepID=UPI0015CA3BC9|nr:hypothetical protein [Jannaschia marina]